MKNSMSMLWAAMPLALLLASPSAFAEKEGHGGVGVRRDSNVVLLDFFESGIDQDPYIERSIKVASWIRDSLAKTFGQKLSTEVLSLLGAKLQEINEVDKVLAHLLVATSGFYQWRWVDAALMPTVDGESTLSLAVEMRVQLATRLNRVIRINRQAWEGLPPAHQAGLIIHELVYASIRPIPMPVNRGEDTSQGPPQRQETSRVRDIVAYLFTQDLRRSGYDGLKTVIADRLPSNPKDGPVAIGLWQDFNTPTYELRYNPVISVKLLRPEYWNRSDEMRSVFFLTISDSNSLAQKVEKLCEKGFDKAGSKPEWAGQINLSFSSESVLFSFGSYFDPEKNHREYVSYGKFPISNEEIKLDPSEGKDFKSTQECQIWLKKRLSQEILRFDAYKE